jgi:Pyruvate/2-oxoacid:ferredoxin oxidoreductase delta subunit
MYKFLLNTKECISCAICVDLCPHIALSMRIYTGKTIEGFHQIASSEFDSLEPYDAEKLSFPFLTDNNLCDGCMICVKECPVVAIIIE